MEISLSPADATQRRVIVMTSTKSRMANKQKLINDLKAVFDSWEKVLAGMNEIGITARPRPGQYSISEVVIHLHAWQQISIAYVKAADNTHPKFPAWLRGADPAYAEDHVDEFNARIQELWRVYSWSKRYREWRDGFVYFLELAEAVPDLVMFDTKRYSWLSGSSLAEVLEGSCEHHQHHLNGVLNAMDNNQVDTLSPVIWKRHDLPGHEVCRILNVDGGWRLIGVSVFFYEGDACRLDYEIDCDQQWITRSTVVNGWVGDRTIRLSIERNNAGQWKVNGEECETVAGCVDIDLNFSPSTNLLPIRRLAFAQDTTSIVRAAWLRFPTFVLEPLEQSYTRIGSRCYRYESSGGQFVANISVDANGLVVDYANLWSRVS